MGEPTLREEAVRHEDRKLEAPNARPAERAAYLSWAEAEQQMILDAMVKARGKRIDAAKLLGWGRSTLWRKMKRYGIDS